MRALGDYSPWPAGTAVWCAVKVSGFSLLECLVVLSCVTLTIGCAFFVYEHCRRATHVGCKRSDAVQQLHKAALLMMRDHARATSTLKSDWHVMPDACIFPVAGGHCGYALYKGRLLRSCGVYNQTVGLWHTRTQALVATGIQASTWVLDIRGGAVRGVRCTLATEGQEVAFYSSCGALCI